jgi:hypothetical protein
MGLEQLQGTSPMDEYNKLSWASLANMRPEQHQAYATQQEDYMRLSDLYNKNAVEKMHPEQLRRASLENVGLDYDNQQQGYLMPTHQLAGGLAQDKLDSQSYRSNQSMLDKATQEASIAAQTNAYRKAAAENKAGGIEPTAQLAAKTAQYNLDQLPTTQATTTATNMTAKNTAVLGQAFTQLNSLDPETITSGQYLDLVNEHYANDPATQLKLTEMGRTQQGRAQVIEKYKAAINKALDAQWANSAEGRKAAAEYNRARLAALGGANPTDLDKHVAAIMAANPKLSRAEAYALAMQIKNASTVRTERSLKEGPDGELTYVETKEKNPRPGQQQGGPEKQAGSTGNKQGNAAVDVTPGSIAAELAKRQGQ